MTDNLGKDFHIFAYAAQGKGLSGGDRIFMELARRISKESNVYIHLSDEGYEMCKKQNLEGKNLKYDTAHLSKYRKFGYLFFYSSLIFTGLVKGVSLNIQNEDSFIYSASEFWMDALPAIILKIRIRSFKWIASWYQTAPSPLKGFASRYRSSSSPYWFIQQISKPFISKYADIICVNNLEEKKIFPKQTKKNNTYIMYGAVDLEKINLYRDKFKNTRKKFDAVFQGRFHPQKGVTELIDIWKLVTNKIPNAKLAMVGDGPLMEEVKAKIKKEKLENNITLFGYLFDGPEKYKIFSESRLVVHPSFYDSGGMASAEAMAFGLTGVGFDLPAYKDYYDKGLTKVPMGDITSFANAIIKLLSNNDLQKKLSEETLVYIHNNWSWDKRVQSFIDFISNVK